MRQASRHARPLLALDAFEEGGRGLKPLGRGQPGVGALGAVAGLDQPLPGARIAGLLQVVGDRVRIGVAARQQRLRHPPVPDPPARRQDALVERLAGQRVDEADARAVPLGLQQVRLDRPLHDRQHRLLVELRHLRPERERHLLPDHGRDRQRLPRRLAEARDPPVDHLAEQRRHDDAVERGERPAVVVRPEQRLLLQRRAAVRWRRRGCPRRAAPGRRRGDPRPRRAKPIARGDEGAQGVLVEPAQVEPLPLRLADQRRHLLGEGMTRRQLVDPVGRQQQERPVPQVGTDVAQEVDAGRVGPVEVLEEDEGRDEWRRARPGIAAPRRRARPGR